MGSPKTDNVLVFVKLNVFRALVSNSRDLGLKPEEHMPDDAQSAFSGPENGNCLSKSLPPALRPTRFQHEIPHHSWIDLLLIGTWHAGQHFTRRWVL